MTDSQDEALERRILELLEQRAPGRTICPSDAARSAYDGDDEGWRDLMEPARRAAGRLVEQGAIEVTQGGEVVDLDAAAGPIRLRRAD